METQAIIISAKDKMHPLLTTAAMEGCSHSFFKAKPHKFTASNPENIEINDGDFVKIKSPMLITLTTIFTVFILPLGVMIAGAAIASAYSLSAALQALCSVAGLIVGGIIAIGIQRIIEKKKKPVIVYCYSEKERNELLSSCGGCTACKR